MLWKELIFHRKKVQKQKVSKLEKETFAIQFKNVWRLEQYSFAQKKKSPRLYLGQKKKCFYWLNERLQRRYTQITWKIGNFTRKRLRSFVRSERTFPRGKARVRTKNMRQSRRGQKPIFHVVWVYFSAVYLKSITHFYVKLIGSVAASKFSVIANGCEPVPACLNCSPRGAPERDWSANKRKINRNKVFRIIISSSYDLFF